LYDYGNNADVSPCAIVNKNGKSLPVSDAPQVSLVLGHALNASNLKEGDDVYFECHVRANPPPRRIVWKKEVGILGLNHRL
jgi:hypothetical protein